MITNHNYARFVGSAIESALAQSAPDVEVIVVDDGSTDGSDVVIAAFGAAVISIFTPNGGQGSAFNVGWAACSGDVVIFLDADDILDPAVAATAALAFDHDPTLSRVQYVLDLIDADGHRTGGSMPADPSRLFRGDAVPRLLTCPDDIVWQPTSGNAFARRALAAIMPMPEPAYRICADYFLSNLAPLHGPVAVLGHTGGGYRVHSGNGHFATAETPARLRQNVERTSVTHGHLIDHAERLGLHGLGHDPDRVRSVSAAANRMISYRLDPGAHPVAADNRMVLVGLGVRSALARTDVRARVRIAMAGWFVCAALAPRRAVRFVARPFVRIVEDVTSTR